MEEAKVKGAGKAASRGGILVNTLEKQVQRLHLPQGKDETLPESSRMDKLREAKWVILRQAPTQIFFSCMFVYLSIIYLRILNFWTISKLS